GVLEQVRTSIAWALARNVVAGRRTLMQLQLSPVMGHQCEYLNQSSIVRSRLATNAPVVVTQPGMPRDKRGLGLADATETLVLQDDRRLALHGISPLRADDDP